MNSILRIYVPSTLNVAAQHTEVLIMILYLTPEKISKQPTHHDQIHYSLRIKSSCKYVRTYVNHVKNICHSELAYPLTKRTLLVIGMSTI